MKKKSKPEASASNIVTTISVRQVACNLTAEELFDAMQVKRETTQEIRALQEELDAVNTRIMKQIRELEAKRSATYALLDTGFTWRPIEVRSELNIDTGATVIRRTDTNEIVTNVL